MTTRQYPHSVKCVISCTTVFAIITKEEESVVVLYGIYIERKPIRRYIIYNCHKLGMRAY